MKTVILLTAAQDAGIFSLDMQTFISVGIQLFNACLLAAVLSFILYKPVRKFMQERAEGIQAQLSYAEDKVLRADELKALYEKKLEDIGHEREKILESAHKLAIEEKEQILHEAKKEITDMKERAEADIQTERERVNEEIRLHIIDVASVMAEKFVAHAIDEDTRNKLFDEAMAELEDTIWQ